MTEVMSWTRWSTSSTWRWPTGASPSFPPRPASGTTSSPGCGMPDGLEPLARMSLGVAALDRRVAFPSGMVQRQRAPAARARRAAVLVATGVPQVPRAFPSEDQLPTQLRYG